MKKKISFSSLWKYINGEKNIPAHILGKCKDGEFYESETYLSYYQGMKAESHFENDVFHGFIDWSNDNKIIEVKRRSKLNINLEIVLQCEIYKDITGKEYEIHIWDRKHPSNTPNYIVSELVVPQVLKDQAKEIINYVRANYKELVKAIYA
jgi:hypothetical protein